MTTRAYGVLWRWHFLAGLAACPVLLVVALTGAIYVFAPELERAASPALFEVDPGRARRPVDALVAALPADCEVRAIEVMPAPTRATEVWCRGTPKRRVMLDPYRGNVLGTIRLDRSVLGIAVDLHTSLMQGDRGELVVEWATSWALLLMISGAYLWWPRGRRGGTWWPRRGVRARQRLRDLHAVLGAYALPALLAIAATGLMWTQLAGARWKQVSADAIDAAWASPPRSVAPAPGAPRIGYDAAIAAAGVVVGHDPRVVNIRIADAPDAAYEVYLYAPDYEAPWTGEAMWIDAYSGELRFRSTWDDRSLLGKVSEAGYAVHVGNLLGWPTRILALLAALVLAGLCVTGPWMWWRRRPAGGLGVPPRARRFAWPLLATLGALGWALPTVGWTLLAVAAIELVVAGWRVVAARLLPGLRGR